MILTADLAMSEALQGHTTAIPMETRNGIRHYLGPRLLHYSPFRARITTRPVPARIVAAEFIWMMSGHCRDLDYLHDHNIHIWDKWGDHNGFLGPIYGVQWREAPTVEEPLFDQVERAIERLIANPGDTQTLVDAWSPDDIDIMALPPCHFAHQPVLVPGGNDTFGLELHVFQRSCDVLIGLPFNMAFYGLVSQFYARIIDSMAPFGVYPSTVHHHISHAHIYDAHLQDPRTAPWLHTAQASLKHTDQRDTVPTWVVPGAAPFLDIYNRNLPAPETLSSFAEPIKPVHPFRLEVIA